MDIDEKKVLKGRGLEIAWLKDPVDVAFLQIQGSGRLVLQNGEIISAGYSAKNGLPYRSIGRYMVEKGYLAKEEISMQAIREYLKQTSGSRAGCPLLQPLLCILPTAGKGSSGQYWSAAHTGKIDRTGFQSFSQRRIGICHL